MRIFEKIYKRFLLKVFRLRVPKHFNFGFDVVDKWAKDADKLALVWVDETCQRQENFTFRDMSILSDKFANVLRKIGAQKGDVGLIMLHRIPQWYIAISGMIKAGVVPTPATSLCTTKDLEYRILRAQVKVVITDEENAPKFDEIKDRCPSLKALILVGGEREGWINYEEEMAKVFSHFARPETRSDDILLLCFTSGTTGNPKMVLHEASYAYAHLITAKFWQDIKPIDLHWTLSDTGWAKAFWGFLGQWVMGAAIFQHDTRGKFDPSLPLKLIEAYDITTFCAPPTAWRQMVLDDLKKYNFRKLRHCCSAGEPLNPETIKTWQEKTGLQIYDGYGQTETVNVLANFSCLPIKPGSMGKPTPGFSVSVVDDEGKELSPGEEGHVVIKVKPRRPLGLLKDYWKDPEEMKKVFRGEWYWTGDMAYKDEEGYFWFVGRSDDVIKSSGYRIGPFEVESALVEHPAVAEAAVVGSPDEIRGEIVKAFVVLRPGFTPSEELTRELQEHVKKVTAPYKYPRKIEYVQELPKTISGKILRKELRKKEFEKQNK